MGKVLVTGGAGFIGTHLVHQLGAEGREVRVLDNFDPQVHGDRNPPPGAGTAEYVTGDVRDPETVAECLDGVDRVVHLAAAVGVGQSMYEVKYYVDVNCTGTAVLWEEILKQGDRIEKVVVASSMSIYGEGDPSLTGENHPLRPASVYAVTKRDQEELSLSLGRAYGIPTVALRFFNVYGPGQSLNNPYTGVAAIFASRLLNGQAPVIFGDGTQTRDFVHVRDIVRGIGLALDRSCPSDAYNVGTGAATSILELAGRLAEALGFTGGIGPSGRVRAGDVIHCVADIAKIRNALGFAPQVTLDSGLRDLISWAGEQQAEDRVAGAVGELESRGLLESVRTGLVEARSGEPNRKARPLREDGPAKLRRDGQVAASVDRGPGGPPPRRGR